MGVTYRVTDATSWRELDGEIVALDKSGSVYFSIDGFGTTLWPFLVSGATKEDLVRRITSLCVDVSTAVASADVDEFIASCLDYGLIEPETD